MLAHQYQLLARREERQAELTRQGLPPALPQDLSRGEARSNPMKLPRKKLTP
jgi:hypothetical protein